jgi:hypothetical protein
MAVTTLPDTPSGAAADDILSSNPIPCLWFSWLVVPLGRRSAHRLTLLFLRPTQTIAAGPSIHHVGAARLIVDIWLR